MGLALFVAAAMTLVLGLVPGDFIQWASHAGFLLCTSRSRVASVVDGLRRCTGELESRCGVHRDE